MHTRPGTTRDTNVEAEVQLVFNENSTKPVPPGPELVVTLKEAVSNPSSGFNLTVDPNSITVVSKLDTNISRLFLLSANVVFKVKGFRSYEHL